MGIPDHLTCLLRNLYAGQEATVRTGHGTTDWSQIGKVHQGCILSPCLFNFYAEYIMIGEGNGNPLQCSCLENPRDSGAWWVAVNGVAQSQTRLKRLSSSSRVHHEKRWAGSTAWNQDCQEKYQQPQICRWHYPYGRKWRGTEKPLDEGVRREWKSWLKAQHSEN